jgi:hypothetical protein
MARVTAKLLPGPALAQLEALKRQRVVIGVLGSEAHKVHPPQVLPETGESTRAHGKRQKAANESFLASGAGGVSNVDVATWMEFGTVTRTGNVGVPERSFLRSTLRLKAGDIRTFVNGRVRRVMAGKLDAATAYEQIGLKVTAFVKATIRAGIQPGLARRSGIPLIDTGQLIGSITHEKRSK